ncbi:MAG: flagellin [Pseudomonadota bacterium]
MISRIGDAAQTQAMTRDILGAQSRVRESQSQISSGKSASRYDQIADRASYLVRAKEHEALIGEYAKGNREVVDRINAMEGAVQTIADSAERFRSLLVQRVDATAGAQVPMESEIENLLLQLEHQLNAKFDNRALFAGSRTDIDPVQIPDPPPTVADPALYYQGDELTPRHRADTGIDVIYGIEASDPAFAGLISALGVALEAHQANDRTGLETALAKATQSIDDIANIRGTLGARSERLQSIATSQDAQMDYLRQTISEIEDVDLATAMAKLAEDRNMLEASYLAVSQINSLSLADYL